MVDFAREQRLALLGDLAVGDVHRYAADPGDVPGSIEARRRSADAPADFAVRALDAEFVLDGLVVREQELQRRLQPLPVLRVNQGAHVLGGYGEIPPVDAEYAVLPVIPQAIAGAALPLP